MTFNIKAQNFAARFLFRFRFTYNFKKPLWMPEYLFKFASENQNPLHNNENLLKNCDSYFPIIFRIHF